jgi:hypothetical protein
MNAGRKETTRANDILWAAPDGSVRVMERATQDVTAEEIAAIEDNDHHPRPPCESKPEDCGGASKTVLRGHARLRLRVRQRAGHLGRARVLGGISGETLIIRRDKPHVLPAGFRGQLRRSGNEPISTKYLIRLVGVTGFEPATPTSRT